MILVALWEPAGRRGGGPDGRFPMVLHRKHVRKGSGRPFVAEPGKGRTLGAERVGREAVPEAYRLILPSKYEVPAVPDFPCGRPI